MFDNFNTSPRNWLVLKEWSRSRSVMMFLLVLVQGFMREGEWLNDAVLSSFYVTT